MFDIPYSQTKPNQTKPKLKPKPNQKYTIILASFNEDVNTKCLLTFFLFLIIFVNKRTSNHNETEKKCFFEIHDEN